MSARAGPVHDTDFALDFIVALRLPDDGLRIRLSSRLRIWATAELNSVNSVELQ